MQRFETHSHTHYSNIRLLDCINTPEKLIDRAIELGLSGIAITDHESLGGSVTIDKYRHEIAEKYPAFKVAIGNEIYLTENRKNGQKYFHFILIAKDAIGHKILRELSSIAWENSYFDRGLERVPTLKVELEKTIKKYGKGHLIATSACLGGELLTNLKNMIECEKIRDIKGKKQYYDNIISFVNFCKDIFGDDFYIEVAPNKQGDQFIVNQRIKKLADYFNIKIVIGTDAHYLTKEQSAIHEAYLNSKGGERETALFYSAAYLQNEKEILENLEGTGLNYEELVLNSSEIYDKIEDFTLARKQHVPQVEVEYFVPDNNVDKNFKKDYPTLAWLLEEGNDQERYWINICLRKLEQLNKFNSEYLARLEEEADINKVIGEKLETCMFAYPIFLQHYIDMFWECGSTVGAGRGSACAGLNHYLLGITQLDPIQHSLPYWRLDIQ